MASPAPTPSTPDLIQASRPGFPKGLRVLFVMQDTATHAAAKRLLEDIGYEVTTATTLEKGIRALESASPAAPFDVTLLEEKQAEPLFLAAAPAAGGGGAASKDLPAGVAGSAQLALGARFAKLASECAIVLMHEEEDVGSKAYMIEAIRVGVVDVVRFPLVAQSMRTLWQHAVRRMIRVAARETRRSERPASARASGGGRRVVGGTERRSDRASADSGDSTASEEGRLKRGASSPESVLPETVKSGAGGTGGTGAATGGKRKAGATGSSGSGSDGGDKESAAKGKEDGGKKSVTGAKAGNAAAAASGPAGKPKPQPRSTQQWRAAEQRGRRLAIKPHTAVVGGVAGVGPGSLNPGAMPGGGAMRGGGGVYYHSGAVGGQPGMAPGAHAHAGVLGQTQTMTINGQQVQVWVPMNGMYQHPQQQQGQQQQQQQGQQQNGQQPAQQQGGGQQADQSNAAANENNNNNAAATTNANATATTNAANNGNNTTTNANGQQQQQPYMYSSGGIITAVGPNGQPMHMAPMNGQQMGYGQMVLVQQPNGQQMYVQAAPGMHQMVNGQMVMNAGQQGQWVQGGQQQQQQQYYQQMPTDGDASQQQGSDGKGGQQVGQQQQQGGFFGTAQNGGAGMPQQMQPQPMPQLDPMDQLKSQPLPLGLNLKRTNSLQNIMGGSLADVIGSPTGGGAMEPISNSMFNDVEMLEEDALDAILAQAKDGNLLSFDGMDEAMLEAAAASGSAAGDLGLVRA